MPGPGQPHARADDTSPAADPLRSRYVARQPILGRRDELVAYELLFRGGSANHFDAADPDLASAQVLERSAAAFGLNAIVGDRRAYVNFTREAVLSGYHRMLPPGRLVVELLEDIEPSPEVIAACQRIRAEGYVLALDDYTFLDSAEPLLGLVDIVKVDLRGSDRALDPRALEPLRKRGVALLAEKVETRAEHAAALAAGYRLFQGYYFCRPQMVETRDLAPSRLAVVAFMAEMIREDEFSLERLEEIFRHDPALTVRLLRYLDSAAFGMRGSIQSLRQGLLVLGLRPLKQWATMIGMMTLGEDHPHELTVTALVRARFAERIALASGQRALADVHFLAGLLSLIDTMLGRPLEEVLSRLAVPSSVREALVRGEGPLAPAMQLVGAYQVGDWAGVEAARIRCGADESAVDAAYVEALGWARGAATA